MTESRKACTHSQKKRRKVEGESNGNRSMVQNVQSISRVVLCFSVNDVFVCMCMCYESDHTFSITTHKIHKTLISYTTNYKLM